MNRSDEPYGIAPGSPLATQAEAQKDPTTRSTSLEINHQDTETLRRVYQEAIKAGHYLLRCENQEQAQSYSEFLKPHLNEVKSADGRTRLDCCIVREKELNVFRLTQVEPETQKELDQRLWRERAFKNAFTKRMNPNWKSHARRAYYAAKSKRKANQKSKIAKAFADPGADGLT